jgi:hypothetical protein
MNTRTQTIAVRSQIHSYSELLQRIHNDLRIQHPEWVEPNGESPICDDYEARLMQLLGPSILQESTSLSLLSIAQSNVDEIESTSRRVMQPARQ